MENNPGWSDTQKMITIVVVVAFVMLIFSWMFFPPKGDPAALAVLNTLTGGLMAGFGMIVNYFFGSSKTSSTKDETIAKMAGTATNGNGHAPGDMTAKNVDITANTATLTEK